MAFTWTFFGKHNRVLILRGMFCGWELVSVLEELLVRIVHVVPTIDEEAAGPSYSVPRLAQAEALLGCEVELACLAAKGCIPGVSTQVFSQWRFARRFAISPSHAIAISEAANQVDIIHNHSLWSMVNVAVGWTVPGKKARLVVSPRGTLSPWALQQSRSIKRLVWPVQMRALDRASLIHATSEEEYRDIRRLGFSAPVAVIPNGIDLPTLGSGKASDRRTLLFLGRLHPTKGLDLLLAAWRELEGRFPEWDLRIVGKGEVVHEAGIREMSKELGLRRVDFAGPLYGQEKSAAFYQAQLFVLPTRSENFGVAVAEALAHGVPALVSHGAPWSGLLAERCGWWIPLSVKELTEALALAMNTPSDSLRDMGVRGRVWMERDYGWDFISRRMIEAYRWVLDGGDCPSFVRTN